MSHARFTESCVLTGFFKHFKGGNFVASRKTHSLIFVASTDELTGSKRKKRALAETLGHPRIFSMAEEAQLADHCKKNG